MKNTLELIRQQPDNGYIFGEIYYNCSKICDTLELESEFYLSEGLYQIFCTTDWILPHNIAIGYLDSEIPISEFCGDNTEMYKKIKIRKGNNHISLGEKINCAELGNSQIAYSAFMARVIAQLTANYQLFLNIATEQTT